ncbi:MAG: nucleotidyltransferase family protein [Desulfomonilaceae bacterium]
MDIYESLKERREEILLVAAQYGASKVRVFGSVARGDAGMDSDVDLLVQFEPGATLLRHAALVRKLKNIMGRDVQVVSERALRPRIRDRIIQEAVPL